VRTNATADRTLYAFRTWAVRRCERCGRDVLSDPRDHYCAVGVECRDGCGQLVMYRGDGAVIGWSSGLAHACPPVRTAKPREDRTDADYRAVDRERTQAPKKRRSLTDTLDLAQEA
jgi:hypothetical protein